MIKNNKKIFNINEIDDVFFNREKTLKNIFSNLTQKLIIFDVGANTGQSIKQFKEWYPKSRVHCFEPDKKIFKKLSLLKFKNAYFNNLALGNKKEIKSLNIYQESGNNSFYTINKNSIMVNSGKHPKLTNGVKENGICQCEIITLDEYVALNNINKINILKIDVQGYEANVLSGSVKTLNKCLIDVIIVEILFEEIYSKRSSFYDIEKIIKDDGYTLWDISHIYKDLETNRTIWVDAIYISNKKLSKLKKEKSCKSS